MLRVRVCAAHMGGFLGQNSLNKGPLFGRFFIDMGWLSRNLRKIAKNESFSVKINNKSGYDRKDRKLLEEGTFLKTGRQMHIRPQDMYPSPSGDKVFDNEACLATDSKSPSPFL